MKIKSFEAYRKDFPMLKQKMQGHPLLYFDSAATALKPQYVIDRIQTFYASEYATVHRAVYETSLQATEKYNAVRVLIKQFINAKQEEEIVFTSGTTEAINLLAFSLGEAVVKKGDDIIISELEHHSNIVPWQMLAQRKGAHLKIIPVNDKGELILEEYAKLLSSKTAIVSIAHISNAIGTIHPIKKMIAMAREYDACVVIDGAQGAAHLAVDVQDLDADFYAFSAHKLMGPTGIGVLYGKYALLEKLPPYHVGGDMIEKVSFKKTTYALPPLKFEAGTPNIAGVIGFGAAIEYLNKLDINKIALWEQTLMQYASKQLESIPNLRIIGNAANKAGIISFVISHIHPLDLGTMLNLKGVAIRTGHHCAQPAMQRYNITATARISFSLFNTKEEVDQLIDYLNEVIQLLN